MGMSTTILAELPPRHKDHALEGIAKVHALFIPGVIRCLGKSELQQNPSLFFNERTNYARLAKIAITSWRTFQVHQVHPQPILKL